MAQVTLQTSGNLAKLEAKLSERSFEVLMKNIASFAEGAVREGFQYSEDPWGRPWAPWAPSTAARKPEGALLLVGKTHQLMNSINSKSDRKSATVGLSAPYAPVLHFGNKPGSGRNMPARPLIPVSLRGNVRLPKEWVAEIQSMIRELLRVT